MGRNLNGKPIRGHELLKKEGMVRHIVILTGSEGAMNNQNSVTGEIVGFQAGQECQFPDNQTECVMGNGEGINLHNYVNSFYEGKIEPVMMDRIRITAGKCLVYLR
jgi:hypothetical protein